MSWKRQKENVITTDSISIIKRKDYFPTNFVVCEEVIYYIDYECNDYMEEWNFENWGIKYWSKTPKFMQYVKDLK